MHDTVGAAHHALAPHGAASPETLQAVDRLLRRRRWRVHPDSANRHALAVAFEALGQVGLELSDATLDTYADAAASVARVDVANVPTDSAEHAVEYVVVGTVLLEPMLLALRRLCQEDQSGRRLAKKRVRTARPTPG